MIKGLYSAASAMLANLTRHGRLSHNVSNLDTPGFKQVLGSLEDFVHTPVVNPPGLGMGAAQLKRIGELGLGVDSTPEVTDFAQGGMRYTGQPLDLAIQGPGFFRIQTPAGERFTRDGRFLRDPEGNLVTVDGYAVLDEGGQPINLEEGNLFIEADGTLRVNGEEAGQLGLATFANPELELERDLPNLFSATGASTGEESAGTNHRGTVQQGYLEMSNANPAQLMTQMVAVSRAYEAAQQMVQVQDQLLGKSIGTLGHF